MSHCDPCELMSTVTYGLHRSIDLLVNCQLYVHRLLQWPPRHLQPPIFLQQVRPCLNILTHTCQGLAPPLFPLQHVVTDHRATFRLDLRARQETILWASPQQLSPRPLYLGLQLPGNLIPIKHLAALASRSPGRA